jgi:hypothetical protein
MATPGRKGRIRIAGAPLDLINAATTANGARTVYTINNVAHRILPPEEAITVSVSTDAGATWTFPQTGWKLNRLLGTVTFTAANPVGALVRVHGKYLPLSIAAYCREWSISLGATNAVITDFESGLWEKRIQTQKTASGSLSKWARIDSYFHETLREGAHVLLELWTDKDAANPDFRVWARLASVEFSASPDAVHEESVDWEGTTDLEGNALATF